MTQGQREFRKKPVVISAIQLRPDTVGDCQEFVGAKEKGAFHECGMGIDVADGQFKITTLEGVMVANLGDWIIRGVSGEFYPCKPDIFEKTYEPAILTPSPTKDKRYDLPICPRCNAEMCEIAVDRLTVLEGYAWACKCTNADFQKGFSVAPSPDPIDAITPTKGETWEQAYERLNPDDKRPEFDEGFNHEFNREALCEWYENVLAWANTLHRPEVLAEGCVGDVIYDGDGRAYFRLILGGRANFYRLELPGINPGQTVKVALVKVSE